MTAVDISNNKEKLDIQYITEFISKSYWAQGRSTESMKRCIDNSLNFGVYLSGRQIGYARVISDYETFAYILDLFIEPAFQKRGYAQLLMQSILNSEKLRNVKSWKLSTKDAHALYQKFGFNALLEPENMMERYEK